MHALRGHPLRLVHPEGSAGPGVHPERLSAGAELYPDHALFLCAAGICLAGPSYGCSPPISSAFVSAFYGTKHFAMNFSIANTMLIPTSFTATLAGPW